MRLQRRNVLAFVCLATLACGPKMVWVHNFGSPQSFAADRYKCFGEANRSVGSFVAPQRKQKHSTVNVSQCVNTGYSPYNSCQPANTSQSADDYYADEINHTLAVAAARNRHNQATDRVFSMCMQAGGWRLVPAE